LIKFGVFSFPASNPSHVILIKKISEYDRIKVPYLSTPPFVTYPRYSFCFMWHQGSTSWPSKDISGFGQRADISLDLVTYLHRSFNVAIYLPSPDPEA
jgi:hypothetical protein